jgi:hypothetical protein
VTRRLVVPAMGLALANLAALGLLIGWVGASRAFTVGVHTLFRDHLAAVVVTLAATAIVAVVLGRSLRTSGEIALVIGLAVVADAVAALLVTLAIDEMRRAAEIAFPRAIFTETIAGLQLLAIAGGATIGYLARKRH